MIGSGVEKNQTRKFPDNSPRKIWCTSRPTHPNLSPDNPVLEHLARCISICHWAGSQKLLPCSASTGLFAVPMVIYLRGDAEDNLCIRGLRCFTKDQSKEHTPIKYPERLNKSYKYLSWSRTQLIFFSFHLFPLKGEKVRNFLNNFTYT